MEAFWDTSAVVPLCVPEQGGEALRPLLEANHPVVWWATVVETLGAIARLARDHRLAARDRDAARELLAQLRADWDEVPPSEEVRETAAVQLDQFALRAADALQLAAALVWCRHQPRGRNFICRDRRLGQVAQDLGFTVVEP